MPESTRYSLQVEPTQPRRDLRKLESRRSPRFPIELWIRVEGIDQVAKLRRGDISAHGIAYETNTSLGDVGSVHWLTLENRHRNERVEVMAHVVRPLTTPVAQGNRTKASQPHATGVALEFMPENDRRVDAIHFFVQNAIAQPLVPNARMTPTSSVENVPTPPSSEPPPGVVGSLITRPPKAGNLSFRTRWRLPLGDVVRVEVSAPGVPLPIRMQGTVVNIETVTGKPDGQFQVDVALEQDRDGPLRRLSSTSLAAVQPSAPNNRSPLESLADADLSRSVDELLQSATTTTTTAADVEPGPDSRARATHLSGILTTGRLPMLAALFEMEGVSGELSLQRGSERATVFVRLGRIVDVAPVDEMLMTPRDVLAKIFEWTEGAFEFTIREVERPDRIDSTIAALLLELAHKTDERNRRR